MARTCGDTREPHRRKSRSRHRSAQRPRTCDRRTRGAIELGAVRNAVRRRGVLDTGQRPVGPSEQHLGTRVRPYPPRVRVRRLVDVARRGHGELLQRVDGCQAGPHRRRAVPQLHHRDDRPRSSPRGSEYVGEFTDQVHEGDDGHRRRRNRAAEPNERRGRVDGGVTKLCRRDEELSYADFLSSCRTWVSPG